MHRKCERVLWKLACQGAAAAGLGKAKDKPLASVKKVNIIFEILLHCKGASGGQAGRHEARTQAIEL
jgi:hypothetical protein